MMRKLCHLLLVAVAGGLGWAGGSRSAAEKPAAQPNIVLIMADDLDYPTEAGAGRGVVSESLLLQV